MRCPNCESEMNSYPYEGKGIWQYDGPSEWVCACGLRMGYFCNQQLGIDEVEPIDCAGCRYHPRVIEL